MSEAPPWSVLPVEGRGLAAFASKAFKAGDEIYRDRPITWVPFHWPFSVDQANEAERRVQKLSDQDRAIFFAAANVHQDAPNEVSGIFYTNAFDMTEAYHGTSCAMYCNIARLNHCCRPNTRQQYDRDTMEMILYASKDIAEGEQLFDSYVNIEEPVNIRRSELMKWFKFWCDCHVCKSEAGEK